MLARLMGAALRLRMLVVMAVLGVAVAGVLALHRVPVDAFPDVTPVQVGVLLEAPGMAAQDVERLLTFPIESALAGLPRVQAMRSLSIFGLSTVTAYFDDDVTVHEARRLVAERLLQAREQLPEGLSDPVLAPNASGLGQVYWYTVESSDGKLSTRELRNLHDWTIRRLLRTAPGVEDVSSFGGEERQYQVHVDARQMVRYGLSLRAVAEAITASNRQVGGQYVNLGAEQYLVRGDGLLTGAADIAGIAVGEAEGLPIYLRDIATIQEGAAIKFGDATRDGKPAVLGIAVQRIGENAKNVVEGVKLRLEQARKSLPAGVVITPVYDRTELVDEAVATARRALLEGAVLVAIVLFVFMGELRAALVVITALPLAMLAAFIGMERIGLSANLMSLAGLAVGLGMIVDGAIVMVENIAHRLAADGAGQRGKLAAIASAADEVARPIAFAIAIIIVVFLPLFSLSDIEGKMFKPMALTISFAMLASLAIALLVIPAASSLVLKVKPQYETRLVRWLSERYRALLAGAFARRRLVLVLASILLVAGCATLPFLGREFMPNLQEGSFLFKIGGVPSSSLEESVRVSQVAERVLLGFPETKSAIATIGRAERGEPEDVNRVELLVALNPRAGWPSAGTYPELSARMSKALEKALPTVMVGPSQPIQMRVEELISGVRAPLALKIYGNDLDELDRIAGAAREALEKIPGLDELSLEPSRGKPTISIKVDRAAAARHGLSADDVLDVVQTGIGGKVVGVVLEGDRRYEIVVRLAEAYRRSPERIAAIPLRGRGGLLATLGAVARIDIEEGHAFVRHEQLSRVSVLQMAVTGRDVNGFVQEAGARLEQALQLPAGYRLEWGGAFENQQRALRRLAIIVPLTIAIIFTLLYVAFGRLRNAVIIIANVPFALVGGVVALLASGQYLSVPSVIGFIAVFGVAMLNGIVLVTFMNERLLAGEDIREAALGGASRRLRPILITASVTILGLLPMLLSRGIGAETQRPLATVVIGGLITSTLLTLFLLPLAYDWVESRSRLRAEGREA